MIDWYSIIQLQYNYYFIIFSCRHFGVSHSIVILLFFAIINVNCFHTAYELQIATYPMDVTNQILSFEKIFDIS